MEYPLLTVNVAVYNQLDKLKVILEALRQQTYQNFEVIVTDDGSSDGTKEWMAKEHPDIQYFWQEDKGFRLALIKNWAINHGKGEYFLSLEGDIIPSKYLLEAYIPFLEPNLMLYGVRHDIEELPQSDTLDFNLLDSLITSYDWRWMYLHDFETIDKPWRICSGCNLMLPMKELREVGGWDETFVKYGGDDIELAVRMWAHGTRIQPVVNAYAYHVAHKINPENKENTDKWMKREMEVGLA